MNDCGRNAQAAALLSCGRYFRKLRSACGTLRLEVCPCDSVFCPDCANRRSKPLQRSLLRKCNRPGRSYWLLTLTVPNIPELSRAYLKKLVAQFAELRESAVWTEIPYNAKERGEITGGVYSIEATFNKKSRMWHPHIHCLIECPKVLQREWIFSVRVAWERITGNAKVVYLQRVFGKSKRGKKLYRRVNLRGLREVVKYVTKCADFSESPQRVDEFLKGFKHVRRIQSFGSFFGVDKEAEREPGDREDVIPGCACGKCTTRDFRVEYGLVHISETVLDADGNRQLKFDFHRELLESVAESPPEFELQREAVETWQQQRIELSGALPEMSEGSPDLFAAVA